MTEPTTAAPTIESSGTPNEFASNAVPSQRDDLIRAAKEASEPAPEAPKAPTEAGPDAVAPAAPTVEETEESPPAKEGIPYLAKVLQERKEKQRQRQEHDEQARANSFELEKERQAIAQMRAEAEQERKTAVVERERIMRLKADPMGAIKELGWDTNDLVNQVARQGSPEWQVQQKLQAQIEALSEQTKKHEELMSAQKAHFEKQEQEQKRAFQANQEKAFVEATATPEKYPNLAKLTPRHRLLLGYDIAEEYHRSTGRLASDEEIAEYLESSLSGETGSTRDARQPTGGNGKAPTSRANGPRTLSNSVASERRSSPKPTSNDLSQEDLRKELIAAAKEAAATTPT